MRRKKKTYVIWDDYELPDGDDGDDLSGNWRFHERRRGPPGWLFAFVGLLVVLAGAVGSYLYVVQRQEDDAFCIGCHTPQHIEYARRAADGVAGGLPQDLSSSHYLKISVAGGTIRCIDCHRGDDSLQHRVESVGLSAVMAAKWLAGRDDPRLEKGGITTDSITVTNGLTVTLAPPKLYLPNLSNDGCIGCHHAILLTAGMDNHVHNMLPAAYTLWKNGGVLIPPKGATDMQAIVAKGLVSYPSTLTCTSCHQAHVSSEADFYLDQTVRVPGACESCHQQAGVKPKK